MFQLKLLTLSSFSKESAFRGIQPLMDSPATAESQAGHPAATCSASNCLGMVPGTSVRATLRSFFLDTESWPAESPTWSSCLGWAFFFFSSLSGFSDVSECLPDDCREGFPFKVGAGWRPKATACLTQAHPMTEHSLGKINRLWRKEALRDLVFLSL